MILRVKCTDYQIIAQQDLVNKQVIDYYYFMALHIVDRSRYKC